MTPRSRSQRPWIGLAAAGALAAAVGACSLVDLPGTGEAANVFTLSPKSTFAPNLPKVGWQLVVEVPVAAGGLATPRIAVKTKPLEIQYYANAQWTEAAPQMVQTLLVESFENTGKIVAVGRQAIGLRSDYNLTSELREFQAEYLDGSPTPAVRVRINAKIIKQPRREIIASTTFEQVVPAASTAMADVVAAFDEALGKVIRRIVEWTLATAA
jgi:cholesterol transport system auxiliary component